MELILLLSAAASLNFASGCVNKINSKMLGNSNSHYSLFIMVNGVISCVYFFAFSGFRLQLNLITAIFSLTYGITVIVSLVFNTKVLGYGGYALISVITTAYTSIVNTGLCFIVFKEEITAQKLIRASIMLIATVVIFLGRKNNMGIKKGFLILMPISLFINTSNFMITKTFTITPGVTDKTSFFFFANMISVIGAAIWFLMDQYRCPISYKEHLEFLNLKRLFFFASNTLCSNLTSIISLQMMSIADVTLYSPFSSALGLFASVAVSFVFKEKLNKFTVIAVALAIIAVLI